MTRTKNHLLSGALGLMLVGGWTAPAYAKWETLHMPVREDNRNCTAEHTVDPNLKERDNRALRLPAGFDKDVEIYGQFIDDPGFVAQLFGPGTASRVKGVGGGFNAARGCGNIGSIVVHLRIPADASAGTSELRIGRGGSDWNSRLDVAIVPLRLASVEWADETLRGTSTVSTKGAVRPGPLDAIGGCIDNLGGSASINGTTLTLVLPRGREEGPTMNCLRRPMFVELQTEFTGPLDTFGAYSPPASPKTDAEFSAVPTYNLPNGLTGLTEVANRKLLRSIQFSDTFLQGFTSGSRRLVLPSNAARANDLIIQVSTQ